ncbi:MAG: alpha-glucuronidase [Lachnospiraceae bacterium]|nr:alpha-glucuronidase [Lachnospiraceae bacterium]
MEYTEAWLKYRRLSLSRQQCEERLYDSLISYAIPFEEGLKESPCFGALISEFENGVEALLGMRPQRVTDGSETLRFAVDPAFGSEDAYSIDFTQNGKNGAITASDVRGLLYGVFHLLRLVATGKSLADFSQTCVPSNPLRMLNHWDNMDGSIERGYSGRSFFFADDQVLVNDRTRAYARLVASVGINAVVINNVNVKNAATYLITDRYFDKVRALSEIFDEYGIALYLSLNFAAPMELGGLDKSDPLDPGVIEWWQKKMAEVFIAVPKLGGFLVKADSEGRPGPFTYGRDHADGANMLARAVAPYGGRIIWRCFVYNCRQDWRDTKTDRARSGYDNFMPLDGRFLDNVILQIKNGPMDFQVREPVHPLFGGLMKTNQMLEVQIAQEYTGQQKHVCYLMPMFKEILDFKTYMPGHEDATVADIISTRTLKNANGGIVAVANTGNDENWTGHDFAAANLFGFGRLAFDTTLDPESIAREWAELTFAGSTKAAIDAIVNILMRSWPAYEKYTSPLGIGWMVNPNHHYGPNVEGYEFDRWGTYHRANWRGIGVDRTTKGTGYTMQYREPNASMYEHVETCPEELLLFFHFIPYDYRLKTGKTLIQHIYDTHFEGAQDAADFLDTWKNLDGQISDKEAYERVLERLKIQAESAVEWRDRINTYFYRHCGTEDEHGRKIYE